jgi:hypothetical protein
MTASVVCIQPLVVSLAMVMLDVLVDDEPQVLLAE